MRFYTNFLLSTVFAFLVAIPVFGGEILTPNLQMRLGNAKSDEKIRINIRLEEQYNREELASKITGTTTREARRAIVVQELRSFADETQKDMLAFLSSQEKSLEVTDIMPLWIVNLINCYATPSVIEQLAEMPGIARIDYDKVRQVIDPEPKALPADKLGDKQNIAWNISLVNAPEVWEEGFDGEDVVVAVLDTGVNGSHLDLAGRMWEHPDYPNHGYNFVNNNLNTNDVHGHGTHCAGTVAGNGTAGTITGVAPGATIMALKVLGDSGGGTEAGVWAAIQFSVDYGAHVMSLSLGWQHSWGPDRAAWRIAMENAMNAGVIAAVAAGNEGNWGGQPPPSNIRTPGDCPAPWTHPDQVATGGNSAVVTVGSTTSTDAISNFSSKGPVTWQHIAPFNDYAYNPGTGLIIPDVVAPGSNILSLNNSGNSGYTTMSGTSMAAPAVAGLMALMIQKNPNITPQDISQILEETAIALSTTKSNTFGSGRIDALAAFEATPFMGIRYLGHSIDDSQGNNDGKVNPAEAIQLSLTFDNPSEDTITSVTATIASVSEYITFTTNTADLGDFNPGDTIDFSNIFAFEVSEIIPGNYEIEFNLTALSPSQPEIEWRSRFTVTAYSQNIIFPGLTVDDSQTGNNSGILDPGETAHLIIEVKNAGQLPTEDIQFQVSSENPWLTIHQQETIDLPALDAGESAEVTVMVSASINTPLETAVELNYLVTSGLYEYSETQEVVVGEAPVYSEGDIPSTFNSAPNASSQAQEPGLLTVSIPYGAVITGVDVHYQITSASGAWVSEQRSILRCVSEGGVSEVSLASGPGTSSGGTVDYDRTGLAIANNVEGGGDIEFELHVFRTWGGSGSNTQYAFVPNNTWKVIVHYELSQQEVTFKVTNNLGEVVEDAQIMVSNMISQTDENGETNIFLPEGTHHYTVSAPRHLTLEEQAFEVTEEENVVLVELTRTWQTTFLVRDSHGNQLHNAKIFIEDEMMQGIQTELINGTYNYRVEAEGYAMEEGIIEIEDKDLLVTPVLAAVYQANFVIADQWGRDVENAVLTIGDETYPEGNYQIEHLFAGSYDFSVTAEHFFLYNGSFEIVEDNLTIEVILVADGTNVEELAGNGLQLFPNPASGIVTVFSENSQLQEISIVDLNGRVVYSQNQINDHEYRFNVADLEAGIYFVRLLNGHENRVVKLQIVH